MADKPWRPHRLYDRERFEVLVAQYGEPAHPPRYGDNPWVAGPTVRTRDGWSRCLWCNLKLTHATRAHEDTCPVGRDLRKQRLDLDWQLALEALEQARNDLASAEAGVARVREEGRVLDAPGPWRDDG